MKKALIALAIAACALAQAVYCISEEPHPVQYELNMLLYENEQAIEITQRVLYTNTAGENVSDVMFFLSANSLRRESTIPYDNDTLEMAFPDYYSPSGAEFLKVQVNGEDAEWAFRGENECYLRVHAPLAPGETCEIFFHYMLLLSENRAFLGISDTEWRLSGFYPSVCVYEDADYCLNALTRAGESMYAPLSDFRISVTAPADYEIAAGSSKITRMDAGENYKTNSFTLSNARSAAVCISRKFHTKTAETESGVTVTAYGQNRISLKKAADTAADAINAFEALFGTFPYADFTIVACDLAEESISASGIAWVNENALSSAGEIVRLAAMQYFSERVHPNPGMEAWLTDGLSEYAGVLYVLETEGESAYRRAVDERLLPSLRITIPGGLTPASETFRFQTQAEYDTVVRFRGAAALHEVFLAVGREEFLSGVSMYLTDNAFTEPVSDDFVRAFNSISGKDRADVIYGWLYTIGDYAGEYLDTLN